MVTESSTRVLVVRSLPPLPPRSVWPWLTPSRRARRPGQRTVTPSSSGHRRTRRVDDEARDRGSVGGHARRRGHEWHRHQRGCDRWCWRGRHRHHRDGLFGFRGRRYRRVRLLACWHRRPRLFARWHRHRLPCGGWNGTRLVGRGQGSFQPKWSDMDPVRPGIADRDACWNVSEFPRVRDPGQQPTRSNVRAAVPATDKFTVYLNSAHRPMPSSHGSFWIDDQRNGCPGGDS